MEALRKHKTSKVYKNFELNVLNEALFSGIDKMFKHGISGLKLIAIDLVNKFIFDREYDPNQNKTSIDIEFSSIKNDDNEGESSKVIELRKRCLFHFYKAMSAETTDIRLKAIEKLSIEPNNPDQNFGILIERLRDQDFRVRIAMIRKLKACRVTFIQLTGEEVYQAVTYCMITRDNGRPH